MKKLFILILLLIIPVSSSARMSAMSVGCGGTAAAAPSCADSSCSGFDVCQNFETATTGWDNGPESWAAACGTDNTCTPAYATAPLRGSQSFYYSSGGSTVMAYYITVTARDEYYGHAIVYFADDAGQNFLSLRNGATTLLSIGWNTANNKFLYDGATMGAVYVHNTTYHIWFRHKKGTGADSISQVWIGTTEDFDAASLDYNISNGNKTSQIDRLYIQGTAGGGVSKFDQILLKPTAIGDVCNP